MSKRKAINEAARWAVRMRSGDVGAEEHRRFESWLGDSSENSHESDMLSFLDEAAFAFADLPEARAMLASDLEDYAAPNEKRCWQRIPSSLASPKWAAAAVAAGVVLMVTILNIPQPAPPSMATVDLSVQTEIGGYGKYDLPDGSTIDLNTRTQLQVLMDSDQQSWNAWSPSLVFSYAWADTMNSYAKVVRGFKSGGFNSFLSATADSTDFDPEYITSWEIDLKSMNLDHRLMLNIAGFYLDYTDVQTNNQNNLTGESVITNEDNLASLGFEVDLSVRPIPGLDIMASLGYTDVRKQGGLEPANQPKWNGRVSAKYSFALSGRFEAVMRGDLLYRSPFHSTIEHIFDNGSSLLANVRTGIEMPDNNWGVYLWGRNPTNRTIISNTVPESPIRAGQYQIRLRQS